MSLKKIFGGDTESVQPMPEAFAEAVQRNMHFLYGSDEKAYKLCFKGVKSAYPIADYTIVSGYGHLAYSVNRKHIFCSCYMTY